MGSVPYARPICEALRESDCCAEAGRTVQQMNVPSRITWRLAFTTPEPAGRNFLFFHKLQSPIRVRTKSSIAWKTASVNLSLLKNSSESMAGRTWFGGTDDHFSSSVISEGRVEKRWSAPPGKSSRTIQQPQSACELGLFIAQGLSGIQSGDSQRWQQTRRGCY